MRKQSDVTSGGRPGESGFALILAILALMLLTFLGLTLAATTSTELQIATNYRWSQQALYNAEAGLEAAKLVLSRVADPVTYWDTTLGPPRTAAWTASTPPAPGPGVFSRDYLHAGCPGDTGGVGYGTVLAEGGVPYEDVSTFMLQPLNGAFTVWVRRALSVDNKGLYLDDTDSSSIVVTAEGVAPFTGAANAFARANQAVRLLEVRFNLELSQKGTACNDRQSAQVGQGPAGDNFNPCAILSPDGSSMANAFGAANTGITGGLVGSGVQ
jgi:type IV pilus assembly PilX-like protein